MNTFFNVKRFLLLFKNDWLLNGKKNLLGFAALAAGMFLFLLVSLPKPWKHQKIVTDLNFYSWPEGNWFQYVMMMVVVFFVVLLLVSFAQLTDKTTRVRYLMLPASSFEKFLHQFLTYVVFLGGMLLLIFWVDAQLIREYTIWKYKLTDEVVALFAPFKFASLFRDVDSAWEAIAMVTVVLSLACYGLMANLWFRKLGWIKMIVVLIVGVYLFTLMMSGLSHLFYPEQTTGFDVNLPMDNLPGSEISLFTIYITSMSYIAWLFLLVIAYFKFKETQV